MFSLTGKVAVVTGALGLIGKNHCTALAEAGAHVVVSDLDGAKCREFALTLEPEALGCSVDITNYDSVLNLKSTILKKFGHIDILVNNAAINEMIENPASDGEKSKFENYPVALMEKSLAVNITGTFICSQILGTVMAENSGGSIINVASTYGIVSPDQSLYKDQHGNQIFYKSPAYPTTKGAILSFTKYLAGYWGEKNVRVNTLTPGGVENGQDKFFINKYADKTPLRRMAKPTDYKGALVFLASDSSGYMTGANLVVDGGYTIW
jgi:NAD(P)-dependent dehydrogenase (short-subunit alcohol dehydrogenase family)